MRTCGTGRDGGRGSGAPLRAPCPRGTLPETTAAAELTTAVAWCLVCEGPPSGSSSVLIRPSGVAAAAAGSGAAPVRRQRRAASAISCS
ncbi:hypothetical protein E2C01_007812 [Portunus trituberculatus]|uniref:Uncharacterized protein n=1 Tax=Portunus trituberculatus TaxID=210409 RepID=A0A5B7D053_PORTR|nr:hypothetical protein [Portunus trituberculatus]